MNDLRRKNKGRAFMARNLDDTDDLRYKHYENTLRNESHKNETTSNNIDIERTNSYQRKDKSKRLQTGRRNRETPRKNPYLEASHMTNVSLEKGVSVAYNKELRKHSDTGKQDGESAKRIVSQVFKKYAMFSKEDDCYMLKQQNLKGIIKDSGLDRKLKLNDIDILLRKLNAHRTKLTEQQFLSFLVMAAKKVFPRVYADNKRKAVDKVVNEYLSEIKIETNDSISASFSTENIRKIIDDYFPDSVTGEMIGDVKEALFDIYEVYFTIELDTKKKALSKVKLFQDSFLSFCKDFGVVPYSLSYSQAVIYYDEAIRRSKAKFEVN